jgi:hypothetical protein
VAETIGRAFAATSPVSRDAFLGGLVVPEDCSRSMNGDALASSASVQIARRLLAREAPPGHKADPKAIGAALERTCVRVSANLCDAMGEDGCAALLARALARAEADHPALKNIRRLNNGGIHLDGVVASIETHGAAHVTAAIEALLAALIDVLGRLIGEDMAIRLVDVDHDTPRSQRGDRAQSP